ncbi:MAG TPA: hypothetical protein VF067_01940 [Sphingomicrobium sp.]
MMTMTLFPLILALAAGQPAMAAASPPAPRLATHHARRLFVSPMGEPFTAGQSGDALADWFLRADRNHDGGLTRDEMQQDADEFFAALDVNHDGEIDPDEITRYETQIAPRNQRSLGLLSLSEPVASADSNFNRGVSLEEFRTAAKHRFAALDVSDQGRLTLDLLENLRPAGPPRERRNVDDPSDHLDANADTGGG